MSLFTQKTYKMKIEIAIFILIILLNKKRGKNDRR